MQWINLAASPIYLLYDEIQGDIISDSIQTAVRYSGNWHINMINVTIGYTQTAFISMLLQEMFNLYAILFKIA